ncbi:MAG: nitroreductase family deazaflavin-dependent oxidoreductase [Anaerolineaceae bacterium]|nr:nitroreductase family deazaflavin-dependent oxidoreductase [Anaerolineaceae bacterium]
MAELSDQDELMRQAFKYGNRFMLLMWRLGLGRMMNAWPDKTGQIMVITHTGRKSGLRRRTPVNYAVVDGVVYCTAAFGKGAHWYKNIMANPSVEVWLPDARWLGTAADVSDDPRRLELLRAVLIASGFAAPAFAGIHPSTMTDAELDTLAADYRLIRIRRVADVTGPGGPGDLSWVWALVGGVLVLRILFPGKRKDKVHPE